MHYDLIIITNMDIDKKQFENLKFIILNDDHYLVDMYQLDNGFSFDYLIFSNLKTVKNINLLTDDSKVITNQFFQTSLDHIFAIGEVNNSKKNLNEQIEIIKEFLNV